jgi:acetyl/propionyl-CoA carboxylase alpha subunit/acetyl-CoA carboxylase carboxyltransferase component
MIKRLLVANRGEIAVRIMATAAVLGIETVAVYPADDAACGHVSRADAAVELPGTGAAAYLDVDAIIAAAAGAGCDTLHPGYGFLSERPELAARCAGAGMRFAGPGPDALALFGDKAAARAQARELGVPVLAGTGGDPSLEQARALLREHGAVMVKAVAGGGGRGLRPVTREAGLAEAMRRCASEAAAAFGDGRVYVEQLLTRARHVEIQVIGDGTGAVAVLGDRDCSLQRRRQKLVEIAPAAISAAVRARLAEAAVALTGSARYAGLATVEFLIQDDTTAFLEVNPRLQVEHTVTEQVTGLDLVELGLRVADGATLSTLGLDALALDALALDALARGVAVQVRVNAETLQPDGAVLPGAGTLSRFQPPAGRGVRVDTAGYQGYTVNPRYDSLLAKVITGGGTLEEAARRAVRALTEFDIAGVPTNVALLQALLRAALLPGPGRGTLEVGWVDAHAAELAAAEPQGTEPQGTEPQGTGPVFAAAPPGHTEVRAPLAGTVVSVAVAPGQLVVPGDELLVIEAMKMEHEVRAQTAGRVREVPVAAGATVPAGKVLVVLAEAGPDVAAPAPADDVPLDHVRPDLAEVRDRHRIGLDEGRPSVTERRHAAGRRTARENLADLADPGSFVEYGALTIAAQRRRRSLDDLIARTPADGLVLGTATVDGRPVAVMSYDYSVLAGTQGFMNHRKTDRLLELADRERLPLVMFAEGGGGRPGDTDTTAVAGLDVPTFRLTARLSGRVPLVAVVSGYCFAGNAALAGACDVIIATPDASLGMGGPAMIEGGGLGVVAPDEIGPMSVQVPNGVVDLLVPDEAAAVAAARRYLSYFGAPRADVRVEHGDQRVLRHLIPENRVRSYDVRPVIEALCDTGSVLELRAGFGTGVLTALARIGGHAVGLLANNPLHLGGAIDGDAADKATAFLRLCQAHRLPVVSLVDTPGFMVGPAAEQTAIVRRFGAMFVAGARLTVPVCAVVLRKAYGLGAMAMTAGDLRRPAITVAWPTGEFGGMGLEGAVRLGYRKELDAIQDPEARQARYEELVAEQYTRGQALSTAMAFEIDDVIDPADTRAVLSDVLARAAAGA